MLVGIQDFHWHKIYTLQIISNFTVADKFFWLKKEDKDKFPKNR